MSNVLELVNIRKSFGTELVLNDLSLAVPEHTATVLIGASGSGKSPYGSGCGKRSSGNSFGGNRSGSDRRGNR